MIAPVSDVGSETLDRDASIPLYLQLAGLLRGRIERGEWRPGQKIPSENELNRLYGVSRMTARQVLAQLVNENLLFRVQGKGTFVAHPKISTRSPAYKGIREQLEGMGYAVATTVLTDKVVPADEPVARALRIPVGERGARGPPRAAARGRRADQPAHLLRTRTARTSTLDDLVDRQLCVILEEDHGLRMSKVNEGLESTLPNGQEAKALQIRRTTPLLLLHPRDRGPEGAAVRVLPDPVPGRQAAAAVPLRPRRPVAAPPGRSPGSVRLLQHPRQRGDVDDARRCGRRGPRAAAPEPPAHPGRSRTTVAAGNGSPPVKELTVTTCRSPAFAAAAAPDSESSTTTASSGSRPSS